MSTDFFRRIFDGHLTNFSICKQKLMVKTWKLRGHPVLESVCCLIVPRATNYPSEAQALYSILSGTSGSAQVSCHKVRSDTRNCKVRIQLQC